MNGDGLADWLVSSISNPSDDPPPVPSGSGNRLYLNNGNMTFKDATDTYGLRDAGWAWGTAAEDFDNDGTLEIAMTNGFDSTAFNSQVDVPGWVRKYFETFRTDRTHFWYRDGRCTETRQLRLESTTPRSAMGWSPSIWTAMATWTCLITPSDGPPRLYRNDTLAVNHWLTVGLDDPTNPGNRWGDGARIEVITDTGDVPVVGWISTGGSYESQKPPLFHVGLGTDDAPIDRIEVFWPGGKRPQVLSRCRGGPAAHHQTFPLKAIQPPQELPHNGVEYRT